MFPGCWDEVQDSVQEHSVQREGPQEHWTVPQDSQGNNITDTACKDDLGRAGLQRAAGMEGERGEEGRVIVMCDSVCVYVYMCVCVCDCLFFFFTGVEGEKGKEGIVLIICETVLIS